VAHYRNHIYPDHALSWEATGGEVAALVTAARPDMLRARVFNAGSRPRKAIARVWQLENGRYDVLLKDEAEAVHSTRTMALKRFSPIELDLPPRELITLEVRQVEKGVPLSRLPDLAIAAEEVKGGQNLEAPVHNIGAVDAVSQSVSVFISP
jgi:hypothetical protein